MSSVKTNQPFLALSKICLNNWHYIDRKILSFHEGINFFTGHSGSGKSTVIDAMQLVLYANTDGRGFFNKAAADDSDRSLIEYLRGMVNIGENNESQYLRNKNFSSTIVLEFTETESRQSQCVGVVFDVETATNVSTTDFYCGPSNERFRKQLYDIYLGGLDMEKFPRLFKRAIPFKMNIKLEDFVKEYICMEQDIHIEDLQESVMQYGRMRSKIEETLKEIRHLEEIRDKYAVYQTQVKEVENDQYQIDRLEILRLEAKLQELLDKIKESQEDIGRQEQAKQNWRQSSRQSRDSMRKCC